MSRVDLACVGAQKGCARSRSHPTGRRAVGALPSVDSFARAETRCVVYLAAITATRRPPPLTVATIFASMANSAKWPSQPSSARLATSPTSSSIRSTPSNSCRCSCRHPKKLFALASVHGSQPCISDVDAQLGWKGLSHNPNRGSIWGRRGAHLRSADQPCARRKRGRTPAWMHSRQRRENCSGAALCLRTWPRRGRTTGGARYWSTCLPP